MPVIPKFQESNNPLPANPVSTDVNPERFGRDAAALSELGGQIGSFGSKLMQARKQAEEADAIANEAAEHRKWYVDRSQKLMMESPDNFAKQLSQESQDRFNGALERMPTGDAQRGYKEKMDSYMAGSYGTSMAIEASNKVKTYRSNLDNRIMDSANRQAFAPDYFSMRDELSGHLDDIYRATGTIISPQEADDMMKATTRSMAVGLLDGYSKDAKSAQLGLDNLPKLSDALSSEEIRMWRDRLEAEVGRGKEKGGHDMNLKLRNIISNLASEEPDKVESVKPADVENMLGEIEKYAVTPGDKAEKQISLISSYRLSQLDGRMAKLAPEDVAAESVRIREELKSEVLGRGFDKFTADAHMNQVDNQIQQHWARISKARNDDLNQFVESNFSDSVLGQVNDFLPSSERITSRQNLSRNVLKQDTKGLLTKSEREILVSRLNSMGESNPDGAANEIQRISNHQYGKEIIAELTNDGKLPAYFRVASYMEDREGALSVIRNFEPKRKEGLEARFKSYEKTDKDAFREALRKKMEPLATSLSASGAANSATIHAFEEAVRLEAMNGMQPGRIGATEASVDAAYKKIVGSHFAFSGKAIIPKKAGGRDVNTQVMEAEMQSIYEPTFWAEKHVKLPDGEGGGAKVQQVEVGPGVTMDYVQGQEAMRGVISRPGAGWVTNPEMSAMVYKIPYRDDPNKFFTLTDDRGVPISIDFYWNSRSPSERAKNNLRSFWDKANIGPAVKDSVDGAASIGSYIKNQWNYFWNSPEQMQVHTGNAAVNPLSSPAQQAQQAKEQEQAPPPQSGSEPAYIDAPYNPKDEVRYRIPLPKEVFLGGSAQASEIHASAESATSTTVVGPKGSKYIPAIKDNAARYSIDPEILYRVLHQESKFRKDIVHGKVKSSVGATGIAQFTTGTARQYGLRVDGKHDDRKNPALAIKASAHYLKDLYTKYGDWQNAVAAYNMGPGNLNAWLKRKGSLKEAMKDKKFPSETRKYIKDVFGG